MRFSSEGGTVSTGRRPKQGWPGIGSEGQIGVYRTKIEHVIANQRARWCGNPPDLPFSQNRPGSSINSEKKRELFYYSILKIRGIGQCAHWLAMTCFCLGSQ